MNNDDMNNMIKKAQEMIQNNQIPDELKNMVANMQKNSANTNNSNNNYTQSSNYNRNNSSNNNTNQDFPNIDVETMMRIQNIMSKMKSADSNDDMSKLLISLKPYLRDEKKGKIDEYIKLIRMGKMTQMFESFGGDKK